jgi:hypothetical protein
MGNCLQMWLVYARGGGGDGRWRANPPPWPPGELEVGEPVGRGAPGAEEADDAEKVRRPGEVEPAAGGANEHGVVSRWHRRRAVSGRAASVVGAAEWISQRWR